MSVQKQNFREQFVRGNDPRSSPAFDLRNEPRIGREPQDQRNNWQVHCDPEYAAIVEDLGER